MKLFTTTKRKTGINLTALVDVLFLLIIFFSVSTRFTNQQAIQVDLPQTENSNTISTTEKLIIIMRDENEVFINGALFQWKVVHSEIEKPKYDRTQKVILNIDKKITHGKVVGLLDLLKTHQYKKVVFGTYGES
ncbi:MAG: biopolymer transporter ExbD [Proteobacteria bacterium]|nr:biopolymer transporter ExbD [Pseudomonadota bacterium]